MPKIVDKTSRRSDIAKIAMELSAVKGFDKTSIREITAQAGMGKGSFYDYFTDKDDLLNEIVQVMFMEWTTLIVSKLENIDDPIAQLSTLLREGSVMGDEFTQLMILYVDIWRRCVREEGSARFIRQFQSFLTDSKKAVAGIIDNAKIQGKIREDIDSSMMATILIALIDGLILHYMVLKPAIDIDGVCQTFMNTLQYGIK
jgi:AcrR family transcriptional regulator